MFFCSKLKKNIDVLFSNCLIFCAFCVMALFFFFFSVLKLDFFLLSGIFLVHVLYLDSETFFKIVVVKNC